MLSGAAGCSVGFATLVAHIFVGSRFFSLNLHHVCRVSVLRLPSCRFCVCRVVGFAFAELSVSCVQLFLQLLPTTDMSAGVKRCGWLQRWIRYTCRSCFPLYLILFNFSNFFVVFCKFCDFLQVCFLSNKFCPQNFYGTKQTLFN